MILDSDDRRVVFQLQFNEVVDQGTIDITSNTEIGSFTLIQDRTDRRPHFSDFPIQIDHIFFYTTRADLKIEHIAQALSNVTIAFLAVTSVLNG